MILKMNFNFNLKDILPRQTRQSAASQPHVNGITLRIPPSKCSGAHGTDCLLGEGAYQPNEPPADRDGSGRQQDIRNFTWTLDMTVVAGLQFVDLPSRRLRFPLKRLKERPGWISFRGPGDKSRGNAGLPIGGKANRFFEAPQTKIA